MPGKHLNVSLLLLLLVCCTTGNNNTTSIFQFQPGPGKLYQFAVTRISTSESAFGIVGDTLNFRFNISPQHVDSNETNVRMEILQLRLAKRPVALANKSVKDNNIPTKDNKFAVMMVSYLKQQQQILDSISGESLILLINKQGNLLMEDGLYELVKSVSKKTGIDSTQVKMIVRDYFSPAAMKDLLTELFFYLPVKYIIRGDTWVNNTMLTALAPVKYSNMMKVDTIDNDNIHLSINSRISAGGEGNTYMDGTRTGSITAALSSGMPLSASFFDETITRTTVDEIKRNRHIEITCITR